MTIPRIRLNRDWTLVHPDNRIDDEVRTPLGTTIKFIRPWYAPYDFESLSVVNTATLQPLIPKVDFIGMELLKVESARAGKAVYDQILFLKPAPASVTIGYQALGRDAAIATDDLERVYQRILSHQSTTPFSTILDRPAKFPPVHHFHDLRDVQNFLPVYEALNRIERAKMLSTTLKLTQIRNSLLAGIQTLAQQNQTVASLLQLYQWYALLPRSYRIGDLMVGHNPPNSGWIAANGQVVLKMDYLQLYSAIGDRNPGPITYNTATHFLIPLLKLDRNLPTWIRAS